MSIVSRTIIISSTINWTFNCSTIYDYFCMSWIICGTISVSSSTIVSTTINIFVNCCIAIYNNIRIIYRTYSNWGTVSITSAKYTSRFYRWYWVIIVWTIANCGMTSNINIWISIKNSRICSTVWPTDSIRTSEYCISDCSAGYLNNTVTISTWCTSTTYNYAWASAFNINKCII